ncbi:murein hydrolase activator EnvC family protein [Evansella tamaricis]|uniref:Peptidoglycan DD-metalloendopeptidase family protein n=1 Tax=Evansella tamaricis TaxID=2069301 RepID=A0ABS6JGK1_9BACI|nr:peptidoglycan DD-metalloendopeptidase family protein [Evansella tamaricis]MBU9712784.1 peptidoglycan DD-metalloendopeptidase family protein [Evansella tamaricis]
MNRRLIFVSLALLLVLMPFTGDLLTSAEANTGRDLEEQIDSYQEQQSELRNEANQAEQELQEVESEIQALESEIRRLDESMAVTNERIDEKQAEIDETKTRIELLREDIVELEERIAQRDALLKDRVRNMYKTGGVINYIEVILGAQSFGDLIERVSALSTIAQQDRHILEQHVLDKEALELAKTMLEGELEGLETQMEELEILMAELEEQKEEKDKIIERLVKKGYSLQEQIMSIEEEQQFLKAQEEAAKKELKLWEEEQRRIEEEKRRQEEERKKQEELERQRQQEQQQQQTGNNNNTDTSQGSGGESNNNAGKLFRPANGGVTSPFNPNRLHPIYRVVRPHNGIDFGHGGVRNPPIYAAEAGTVIQTSWMGGFGNTIMISHIIDGKPYTTLYAHLASFNVSPGQRVSRGQVIGVMGTTGDSTGVHLHFELHPGGYSGRSSAVNPAPYLN